MKKVAIGIQAGKCNSVNFLFQNSVWMGSNFVTIHVTYRFLS